MILKRSLNHSVLRRLSRPYQRYASKMLHGARRRPPPDYFGAACRALDQFLRHQARMAKENPHLFGPNADRYFRDTVELAREHHETEALLRQAYGPPAPGTPCHVPTTWTDRYFVPPEQRKIFLKWFKENYPSRPAS